jgi:hypothetical protein
MCANCVACDRMSSCRQLRFNVEPSNQYQAASGADYHRVMLIAGINYVFTQKRVRYVSLVTIVN